MANLASLDTTVENHLKNVDLDAIDSLAQAQTIKLYIAKMAMVYGITLPGYLMQHEWLLTEVSINVERVAIMLCKSLW